MTTVLPGDRQSFCFCCRAHLHFQHSGSHGRRTAEGLPGGPGQPYALSHPPAVALWSALPRGGLGFVGCELRPDLGSCAMAGPVCARSEGTRAERAAGVAAPGQAHGAVPTGREAGCQHGAHARGLRARPCPPPRRARGREGRLPVASGSQAVRPARCSSPAQERK